MMMQLLSQLFDLGTTIANSFGLKFALIVWKPGMEHKPEEVMILSPQSTERGDMATVLSTARSFHATTS